MHKDKLMVIPDKQHIVTVDYESYWDPDFTLSKLSTSEYVRDPRFKVHCAAIKIGDGPTKVVWGHKEVGRALKKIDWKTHGFLAQNTAFDGFITAHCYGIVPCFYFDTKSMAAGLLNGVTRTGLKVLAPLYGVGVKNDTSLQSTKGYLEIPPEWRQAFETYNKEDAEQCYGIAMEQLKGFPERELRVIDLVIRMFCDSPLEVDIELARDGLAAELMARRSEILKSGVSEEELMSDEKFAVHLIKLLGEDNIPTKISPATGKVTFAFSQTDESFIELQDHEDVRVAKLVRGRLAAKSKQAETRAYRLIEAGRDGQKLPVGYTYSAALTHRFGGTNKLNLQNLPRVNPYEPKPSDAIRRSIIAPDGHVLVVVDSAQIEARVNAWLCGQYDLLEKFAKKEDVYKYMASLIYGIPVEEVTKDQRFIGKIAVLGLGYGMGAAKFQTTLALGLMGPAVELPLAECKRIVNLYRRNNSAISGITGWGEAERMVRQMQSGNEGTAFNGLIHYDATSVWLPNGMPIHYPQLAYNESGDLTYNTLKGRRKLYGGKIIENLVQALARIIVVGHQMIEIQDSLGKVRLKKGERATICMSTHDENIACVPDRFKDMVLAKMLNIMRSPPEWCLDIPLDAEGGYDRCYSK